METKKCPKCGQELSLDNFYKNKSQPDGYQVYCKKCHDEIVIKSKERNKFDNLKKVYSKPELAQFTPRELMTELKARGYRWDYMLEPQRKIMFDKI